MNQPYDADGAREVSDDGDVSGARAVEAALRQRTRELRESEDRFRNIVDRTTDGIIIVGSEGQVLFANPAAEALFARAAPDLIGQPFGLPLAADATEVDIVRADGVEAVVELRTAPTQWRGEAAQLVALRDITDRKRAEQRAQHLLLEQAAREQAEAAHRRARFLVEASARLDASLELDATLAELARLIVPRLADWCLIDVLGENDTRTLVGVHEQSERQPALDALRRKLRKPGPAGRLFRSEKPVLLSELDASRLRRIAGDDTIGDLLAELGTRSVIVLPLVSRAETLGAMTMGCAEEGFDAADFSLAEDIAVRAARAIDNARLYRAALAASQAKSDFLAVVSHELRTPLNAIMGYTEMLMTGVYGAVDEPQLAKLQRIDASARHLLQIIDEILAHAALERDGQRPRPHQFRLHDVIDGALAIAEPLARARQLTLDVDVRAPDASCFTDASRLRQILVNLLSNAVKFSAQGSIILTADYEHPDIVLTVTDHGVGIAPEHVDLIFEPFWQAEQPLRRNMGGTGLGLSVARRLAELLGGGITVHSEVGAGSTFTLRVPAHLNA